MNTVADQKTAFLPDHLLSQVGFDAEMQLAIIDAFVDNFPGLLEKLSTATARMDRESLKHVLHQAKSSLSLFGGDQCYLKAHQLEKNINHLPDEDLRQAMNGIMKTGRQLLDEVLDFRRLHKKTL